MNVVLPLRHFLLVSEIVSILSGTYYAVLCRSYIISVTGCPVIIIIIDGRRHSRRRLKKCVTNYCIYLFST